MKKFWKVVGWIVWTLWVLAFLSCIAALAAMCVSCGYKKECYHGCPKPTDAPTTIVVGPTGQGCSTTRVDGGAEIQCGDESTVVYDGENGADGVAGKDGTNGKDGLNGKDGADGKDGTSSIQKVVTLCGSKQQFAEIAMEVNNQWVAYFQNSDGSDPRLTVLVPNVNYMSTDGFDTCVFTTADLDAMPGN